MKRTMRWGRFGVARGFACLALLTGVACQGSLETARRPWTSKRTITEGKVDVATRNLSPTDEIEALRHGITGVGRADGAYRVAIPPFKVTGDGIEPWMGEALAEVVSVGLAKTDGVSVIERAQLDALVALSKGNNADTPEGRMTGGRLIGAKLLVLGSIHREGKATKVLVRSIRVEDGIVSGTAQGTLSGDDWEAALRPVVDSLLHQLGANPTQSGDGLTQEALQKASSARALQQEGRLLEAQPLYAAALPVPSTAWRFEADYIRLMANLGMTEWAAHRADAVLEKMPPGMATVCDRASLLVQRNRHDPSVDAARDAVRVASSCGDPSIVAQSLVSLHVAVGSNDFPMGVAALEAARKMVTGSSENAWLLCDIDSIDDWLSVHWKLDRKGDPTPRQLELAQRCASAGNTNTAAMSLQAAGTYAWLPADREKHFRAAVKQAQAVGGQTLDGARAALAAELRAAGRPSEADAQLLDTIGTRVKALIELYKGIPDDVNALDGDLLRAAGVKRPSKANGPLSTDADLLARVHRNVLARALRRWVDRTRPVSNRQADFYASIADKIDPPKETPISGETVQRRFERRLEKAKISLDGILSASSAPLRGSGVNISDAYEAIHEWFNTILSDASAKDLRVKLVEAARKIASWTQRPRMYRAEKAIEAWHAQSLADWPTVVRAINEGATLSPDDPSWDTETAALKIDALERTKPDEALAAYEGIVRSGKRISPAAWVQTLNDAAFGRWKNHGKPGPEAIKPLLDAADELDKQGAYEAAALALEKAAYLQKTTARVEGSDEAYRLSARRVDILSKLNDPLRTATAQGNLMEELYLALFQGFRGNADRMLAKDPRGQAVFKLIDATAHDFVKSSRFRDGVRLVVSLRPSLLGRGALLDEALSWSENFSDSAEYPSLAGSLYRIRGNLKQGGPKGDADLAKAVQLYAKGGDIPFATWTAKSWLRTARDEKTLFARYRVCRDITKIPIRAMDCVDGLWSGMIDIPGMYVEKKELWAEALADGLKLLPGVDAGTNALDRYSFRTGLAIIAARAGDLQALHRMNDEVKTYYTKTAPEPYQYSTHLARVAIGARFVAPRVSLEMYQEFEAFGGGDYWKAGDYPTALEAAILLGDTKAQKMFEDMGKRLVKSYPQFAVRWATVRLAKAVAKKDWSGAESILKNASAEVKKALPDAVWALRDLELKIALSRVLRKDNSGAMNALKEQLKLAEAAAAAPQTEGQPYCHFAHVAEVVAASRMAAKSCDDGAKLRTLATQLKQRCEVRVVYEERSNDVIWADEPAPQDWIPENTCGEALSVNAGERL